MSALGMEMLRGLLVAGDNPRPDCRAYEVASQAEAARLLAVSGDLDGAERRLRAALDAIEAAKAASAAALPFGYDTAFGYLARTMPAVLDLLDDLPRALEDDAAAAETLCAKRGMRSITVQAPAAVVEAGGDVLCPAFPVAVLEELYSAAVVH